MMIKAALVVFVYKVRSCLRLTWRSAEVLGIPMTYKAHKNILLKSTPPPQNYEKENQIRFDM